jgi:rubrerythrin
MKCRSDLACVGRCWKTGKIMHSSRRYAKLHAKRMRRTLLEDRTNFRVNVYRCRHCDHFHVGRQAIRFDRPG